MFIRHMGSRCGMQHRQQSLLLLLLLLVTHSSNGLPAAQETVEEDAMDASKSPCENFHEHACGNWHAPYGLRALGAHDMRSKMRALNKQLLVRHFEARQLDRQADREADREGQQLLLFYDSCMSGRQTLHVYVETLQQLLPDWPLLSNATATTGTTHFDWARGSAAVRRFGAQGLWRLLVQPNWQAAEQRIFYLLQPSFELLGTTAESEFLYQRYLKYLLLELGLRVRRAALLAEQLVAFEQQLKRLVPAAEDSAHTLVLHAPQTLQQLAVQLPQLQLHSYFQLLLGADYTPELSLVADVEYLQRLQRLLRSSDPLIVSSWLLLQLPAHFELHLDEETTLAAQRENCLQQLNELLPQQLLQLQLRLLHGSNEAAAAFLTHTQHELQQLFDTLKLQFERQLNATPIFENDTATQTLALQKLRAMRLLLPSYSQQGQQRVAEAAAPQQSLGYDANLLHLSQAHVVQQFRSALECLQLPCGSSGGGSAWSVNSLGPLDVNVYYRLKLNAIELPLGLLRAPLLAQLPAPLPTPVSNTTTGQHSARLYGGLGYMLAHEMLHGFDYDGINYDATGRVAGVQWPARAIIRFGLRAGCYLDSRYSNASITINENIADSEGLRLAFEAYRQHWPLAQAEKGRMRDFFVAFAQNWCGHAVAPSAGSHQQHGAHWERVNNVLGNFPEFADAFSCKAGSLMHPPNKCRIW